MKVSASEYIAAETDPRGKLSQRARILHLLLSAPEVALPAILDLRVSQYNARINELRGLGFDIRNRTQRIEGVVHSWYALNFEPRHDPPASPNSGSGDWFERQTGQKRPAPPRPDLGPLFQETHGS